MSRFQKVIWDEGMFLSPHHFQKWERYLMDEQLARFKALNSFEWGITKLKIKTDELASGSFSIIQADGIMPDGQPFEIPESDPLPDLRLIGELFGHLAEKLEVYLGIPVERSDTPNCKFSEESRGRETRFISDYINVSDENTGENRREIQIARTNYKILFGGEKLDDYSTVKIAELVRDPNGTIVLRKDFIPPCLIISASNRIMELLRELLEKLSGQSADLSQQVGLKANQYDLNARDLENFTKLLIINTYLPQLSHYFHNSKTNPEILYCLIAELAGALTAFNPQVGPKDIPAYNHNGLTNSFNVLAQLIFRLIGGVATANYVTIPLQKISESRMEAEIPLDLFAGAIIYLAVKANIPEAQLQNMLPKVIKISSPDQLDFLISRALPGLPLTFTSRPHPEIPPKVGFVYLQLSTQGELWEGIKNSKKLAIYLPAGIPGLVLEMVAVKTGVPNRS